MTTVDVTLIGKPGCHLCDDARTVIEEVLGTLAADGIDARLHERDILEDEALARKYAEEIPVVMIGQKRHAIWRVDPEKFATSIRKAATKTGWFGGRKTKGNT